MPKTRKQRNNKNNFRNKGGGKEGFFSRLSNKIPVLRRRAQSESTPTRPLSEMGDEQIQKILDIRKDWLLKLMNEDNSKWMKLSEENDKAQEDKVERREKAMTVLRRS